MNYQIKTMLILKYGSLMAAYLTWLDFIDSTAEFSEEEIAVVLDWRREFGERHPELRFSHASQMSKMLVE
jgi:pantothenate kinase-related protein Tda10